jgi:predicted Zn finger-like uncharacterized protein
MSTLFDCPECKYQMRVQEAMLGKKVRCPQCKSVIEAPKPPEPELYAELVEHNVGIAEEPIPVATRAEPRRRYRDDNDLEELGDIRPGIPTSVVVAITATSLLVCLDVVLGVLVVVVSAERDPEELGKNLAKLIVGGVVGGLILWGLVAGHRLAWQWGRILGAVWAVISLIVLLVALTHVSKEANPTPFYILAGLSILVAACLLTITISLGAKSAKQHFGLRCPSCKRFTSSAGDFWFNTAKCKRCSKVW